MNKSRRNRFELTISALSSDLSPACKNCSLNFSDKVIEKKCKDCFADFCPSCFNRHNDCPSKKKPMILEAPEKVAKELKKSKIAETLLECNEPEPHMEISSPQKSFHTSGNGSDYNEPNADIEISSLPEGIQTLGQELNNADHVHNEFCRHSEPSSFSIAGYNLTEVDDVLVKALPELFSSGYRFAQHQETNVTFAFGQAYRKKLVGVTAQTSLIFLQAMKDFVQEICFVFVLQEQVIEYKKNNQDVKNDWELKLIPASDFELDYYTEETDFGSVDEAMASKILHSVATQLMFQREKSQVDNDDISISSNSDTNSLEGGGVGKTSPKKESFHKQTIRRASAGRISKPVNRTITEAQFVTPKQKKFKKTEKVVEKLQPKKQQKKSPKKKLEDKKEKNFLTKNSAPLSREVALTVTNEKEKEIPVPIESTTFRSRDVIESIREHSSIQKAYHEAKMLELENSLKQEEAFQALASSKFAASRESQIQSHLESFVKPPNPKFPSHRSLHPQDFYSREPFGYSSFNQGYQEHGHSQQSHGGPYGDPKQSSTPRLFDNGYQVHGHTFQSHWNGYQEHGHNDQSHRSPYDVPRPSFPPRSFDQFYQDNGHNSQRHWHGGPSNESFTSSSFAEGYCQNHQSHAGPYEDPRQSYTSRSLAQRYSYENNYVHRGPNNFN